MLDQFRSGEVLLCVCVCERAQLLTVKFCQNVECVFYLLITISVCVEYSRPFFAELCDS